MGILRGFVENAPSWGLCVSSLQSSRNFRKHFPHKRVVDCLISLLGQQVDLCFQSGDLPMSAQNYRKAVTPRVVGRVRGLTAFFFKPVPKGVALNQLRAHHNVYGGR